LGIVAVFLLEDSSRVNYSKPRNLNLSTIRFPLPAIVSILHRLSGIFLFLLIPVILWGLDFSLHEEGFAVLRQWLGSSYIRAICWLLLVPFIYHLIAGVRHLLSDVHLGNTLQGGRRASQLTLIIFVILALLAGGWLW
jgi:succinate dehydrogenase / fumarate reductase cytochrome b subunit